MESFYLHITSQKTTSSFPSSDESRGRIRTPTLKFSLLPSMYNFKMVELVPEDFLLSPEAFEANFVAKRDIAKLREAAIHGGLGHLGNRFLAWRLFLSILPEDGTPDDWVRVTRQHRESYRKLTDSQRVRYIQGVAAHDLDPVIFNPLSPAQEV